MVITILFDGACEPINPKGIATYGYIIFNNDKLMREGKGLAFKPFSEESTNNTAEYTAMIKALEYLEEQNMTQEEIIIRGDSEVAIRQIFGYDKNGKCKYYKVDSENLLPLYYYMKYFLDRFSKINGEWIEGDKNELADKLSRDAYNDFVENNPEVQEQIKPYLATDKQKEFMKQLKIEYSKYISKIQASRLIKKELEKREKK